MCGIAGLLGRSADGFAERVRPHLDHRGPDDSGMWRDESTCLVQTRLAILDLSAAGHQPMASACGRWWLVFNGEIYNHHELRLRLLETGERFHGNGDTEVLLAWMIRFGIEGLRDLRGMYAFCLYDTKERRALLARDPHGIKPLYYWHGPSGELVFASELRALLASDLMPRRLDQEALAGFLSAGSVAEPATLVEGIFRLPAGALAQWHSGSLRVHPFGPLPESQPSPRGDWTQAGAVALTRSALEDSVAAHMVSDVRVGLFLSGGLDSAAILALAPRGLHTFTIGFDDAGAAGFDESEPAAQISSHFGGTHTLLKLSANQARDWLPEFLASQDQPSLDGYNTWCVSRLAHGQGLKVALSGLGGDELFGGYPSFRVVPRLRRWRRRLGPAGPVGAALMRHGPGGHAHRRQRLSDLLETPASMARAYRCVRSLFTALEVNQLLTHWGLKPGNAGTGMALQEPPPGSDLDAVAWLEGTRYLRNQLLPDSDVMAMAAALELRLPFVDARLQNALAPIPASMRLAPGKALLQQAVPELPEWFKQRPKQGFRFPFQLWLDDPASRLTLRLPGTPAGLDLAPWYRRWSLMVLEQWLRQHLAIELPLS